MNFPELMQTTGAVSGLVCLTYILLAAKKQLKSHCTGKKCH